MKFRILLVAVMICIGAASAQHEAPTVNPAEVIVKGRRVTHSWRDGRIWVATADLKALLNVDSEMPDMDWGVTEERFEAKHDPSLYSLNDNPSKARRKNAAPSLSWRTMRA